MKVLIAGDYVPTGRMKNCLDKSFGAGIIKSITDKVDYSILNFESPIVTDVSKGIRKNGPKLKVTEKSLLGVTAMGFSAVTLANNHFRDYGDEGVATTIKYLEANDIDHVGGGKNIDEANKVLYKKIGADTLAIINFCEHEFSYSTKVRGGAAPFDFIDVLKKIRETKRKADFILAIIHGGHEGFQLPSPRMKSTYRFLIEEGVSAVINHHQHCYSGYEIYKGKPIFYGLGNFLFDWDGKRNDIWNEGYIVILNFCFGKMDFEIIPYEQCNETPGVFLLNEKDSSRFWKRIDYLNEIIQDDERLEGEFDAFVKEKAKGVLATLGPFSNRYLMALISRGVIPSFICKKKAAMLYNYINCEAHRDTTIKTLEELLR